jgi:hypothetical protein
VMGKSSPSFILPAPRIPYSHAKSQVPEIPHLADLDQETEIEAASAEGRPQRNQTQPPSSCK